MSEWVSRLSGRSLPPLRRTLTRVKDLLNNSSANHTALSEIIAFDPGFCLHILRQLRTLPNQPKEPITKISNAIPLLGMSAIEQAAHSLPALEDQLKGPPRRGLIDCYSRAAHASIYAAGLAERRREPDPQAFATAALLHDIGEMMLWSQAAEKMREVGQLMARGDGREAAALEILGFTFEKLNQALGNRWQLPGLIPDAQGLFNSFQSRPLTVILACAVARASAKDWKNQEILDNLELLADFLGLPIDRVEAELHQSAAHAARQLQLLPLPLPAFQLIQTSNLVIDAYPLPSGNKAEAKVETPIIQQQGVQASDRPPAMQVPFKPALKSAAPKHPLHENLIRTIQEMRDLYGLQNVMFAMLSTDKKQLKARYTVGNSAQERLQGFTVDLERPSLFIALLKKPQALWVNSKNLQKYRPMIPESSRQSVCMQGFLLMSIFIRNRSIGLFYADNGCHRNALTIDHYNNFKVLCQRFMQTMN
ncbi:MAG: HDOD domain-containing protein [Pseudomonadota bacterium]